MKLKGLNQYRSVFLPAWSKPARPNDNDRFRPFEWLRSREYSPRDIAAAILPLSRFALLRIRHSNIHGGPVSIRGGADIKVKEEAIATFGRFVRILPDFTGRINGRLDVGDDVFFNRGCYVAALDHVSIGSHCMFGEYVSIHDENHVVDSSHVPIAEQGYTTAPIVIGENVWVGAKATILGGVKIGSNSIIGANAVVTRDIPANSVAVGVPASVIRSRSGDDPFATSLTRESA